MAGDRRDAFEVGTDPGRIPYVPLAGQPAGVSWPAGAWPTGEPPGGVDVAGLLDELFDDPTGPLGRTYVAVAIHGGRLVAERYSVGRAGAAGAGRQDDTAGYASRRPLTATPGERYSYSSGTTNILSAMVRRVVGPGEAYRRYVQERIFGPLGMSSARPIDDEHGYYYGAHWWATGDEHGTLRASAYEGRTILVSLGLDLVVVRFGRTPDELSPSLEAWRHRVVAAFAAGAT